jgi:hypothetical protein
MELGAIHRSSSWIGDVHADGVPRVRVGRPLVGPHISARVGRVARTGGYTRPPTESISTRASGRPGRRGLPGWSTAAVLVRSSRWKTWRCRNPELYGEMSYPVSPSFFTILNWVRPVFASLAQRRILARRETGADLRRTTGRIESGNPILRVRQAASASRARGRQVPRGPARAARTARNADQPDRSGHHRHAHRRGDPTTVEAPDDRRQQPSPHPRRRGLAGGFCCWRADRLDRHIPHGAKPDVRRKAGLCAAHPLTRVSPRVGGRPHSPIAAYSAQDRPPTDLPGRVSDSSKIHRTLPPCRRREGGTEHP